MAWKAAASVPFVVTGSLFFSPIFGTRVYVIDQGLHFYSYTLGTKAWSLLASPNFTLSDGQRTLVPDSISSPTRLYCISQTIGNQAGLRISTYTIASNSWSDSPMCPSWDMRLSGIPSGAFVAGEQVVGGTSGATGWFFAQGADYIDVYPGDELSFQVGELVTGTVSGQTVVVTGTWSSGGNCILKSLVYVNPTTIYVWAGRRDGTGVGNCNQGKCIRYNPGAGAPPYFTVFPAVGSSVFGTAAATFVAKAAAINGAGTVVYGGDVRFSGRYCTYTIAIDTYALPAPAASGSYIDVCDPLRLWYRHFVGGGGWEHIRFGYYLISANTFYDSHWEGNSARTQTPQSGVSGNVAVIDQATNINPMAYSNGVLIPTVQTNPATESQSYPVLNGTITDDGGLVCEARFEYGLTLALGSFTSWKAGLTTGGAFSQLMTGLAPGAQYYFRAQARNATGAIVSGATLSFTVGKGSQPSVATLDATDVSENAAQLNGVVVDDLGFPGRVRFEYGATSSYGEATPWQDGFAAGVSFSALVGNFSEGGAYHYRAHFQNRAGVAYGADKSWNTPSSSGPMTLMGDDVLQLLEAAA